MLEAVFVLILIILVFLYYFVCGFRAASGRFYFLVFDPTNPGFQGKLFLSIFLHQRLD